MKFPTRKGRHVYIDEIEPGAEDWYSWKEPLSPELQAEADREWDEIEQSRDRLGRPKEN